MIANVGWLVGWLVVLRRAQTINVGEEREPCVGRDCVRYILGFANIYIGEPFINASVGRLVVRRTAQTINFGEEREPCVGRDCGVGISYFCNQIKKMIFSHSFYCSIMFSIVLYIYRTKELTIKELTIKY